MKKRWCPWSSANPRFPDRLGMRGNAEAMNATSATRSITNVEARGLFTMYYRSRCPASDSGCWNRDSRNLRAWRPVRAFVVVVADPLDECSPVIGETFAPGYGPLGSARRQRSVCCGQWGWGPGKSANGIRLHECVWSAPCSVPLTSARPRGGGKLLEQARRRHCAQRAAGCSRLRGFSAARAPRRPRGVPAGTRRGGRTRPSSTLRLRARGRRASCRSRDR